MTRFILAGTAIVAGVVLMLVASFGDPAAIVGAVRRNVTSISAAATRPAPLPAAQPPAAPITAPPSRPVADNRTLAAAGPPSRSWPMPQPDVNPSQPAPKAEDTSRLAEQRASLQRQIEVLQAQLADTSEGLADLRNQQQQVQRDLAAMAAQRSQTLEALRSQQQQVQRDLAAIEAQRARAQASLQVAQLAAADQQARSAAQMPQPAPAPQPATPDQTATNQGLNSQGSSNQGPANQGQANQDHHPAAPVSAPAAPARSQSMAAGGDRTRSPTPPTSRTPPVRQEADANQAATERTHRPPPNGNRSPPARQEVASDQGSAERVHRPPGANRPPQPRQEAEADLLDRLRRTEGPPPQSPPPPVPRPAPDMATRDELQRARGDLASGRIDDARRELQVAQLRLVFRPVGPDGGPTPAGRSAADVARALTMLGFGNTPQAMRAIDQALADADETTATLSAYTNPPR